MNKAIAVFIGFVLIPLVYPSADGQCLNQERITDPSNCKSLTTSDDTIYFCTFDQKTKKCKEISKCERDKETGSSPRTRDYCSSVNARPSCKCVLDEETKQCMEVSECEGKYFYAKYGRRLSSSAESEEDCLDLKTLDDDIFKCTFNGEKHICEDKPKNCGEVGKYYSKLEEYELKCEDLEVSDSKYKCALNKEKDGCEESNASTIKLSTLLLFGLLFLF